jgi:hypothetical protein
MRVCMCVCMFLTYISCEREKYTSSHLSIYIHTHTADLIKSHLFPFLADQALLILTFKFPRPPTGVRLEKAIKDVTRILEEDPSIELSTWPRAKTHTHTHTQQAHVWQGASSKGMSVTDANDAQHTHTHTHSMHMSGKVLAAMVCA